MTPSLFVQQVLHRRALAALTGQKHRRRRIPAQRQPNAVRLAYWTALRGVLEQAQALVTGRLVPALPALVVAAGQVHDAVPGRTYADEVQRILNSVSEVFFAEFTNERLRNLALSMGRRASAQQREELNRQLRATFGRQISIDIFAEQGMDDRLQAFAAANVQLVKRVPQQFFDEVGTRVVQGLRAGERAEALQKDIEDRYGVSESRARLIARDQVGKLTGELNSARQQDLGIERFTWRTAGDERVRPEHEELDGQVFRWDDPPGEGIPGSPVNCRCSAEPILSDIYEAL